MRRFKVILEWDAEDQVWVSNVPSLGHLSTFGKTRDVALAMTREAIIGYFEAAEKENIHLRACPDPEVVDLEVAV